MLVEDISFKEFKEILGGLNLSEIRNIMDALKIKEREK
jgi:hypothetical protein